MSRAGSLHASPHILDYGLARPYPGGAPLSGESGSGEWNSIRSAEGAARRPEDDLESLGWILAQCLYKLLPWFSTLQVAYENWHEPKRRQETVRQVRSLKQKLLQ